MVGYLPDLCSLFLGNEELVALLDAKGIIPSINMRQGSIHTSLRRRVNINGNQILHILRTEITSPYARPAQEETLVGSEALDLACRFLLQDILQSTVGNVQTTIVANVLAQCLLAVNLLAR